EGAALRVRAHLGIARGGYETSGDLDDALGMLDAAERSCVAADLDEERLAVWGQRGLLLLRSGDLEGAREALDRIAPGPGAEPTYDLGIVLLNRGALHLEAGEPSAAARDLRAAPEIARRIENSALGAAARPNLGYAAFLGGDLP